MNFFTKDEIVNSVYQSTNHEKFKLRSDNRKIKQLQIKKLIKSLNENGWEPGSYVVVNEKNEIIDGQHRWLASKELGIPFLYIREPKADIQTIRILNSNQKNWTLEDHLYGFASTGNEDYVKAVEFMEEYPDFSPTDAMCLTQNSHTVVPKELYESGKFTVKDMYLARVWANNIMELKQYFKKGYKMSSFIRALIKVMANSQEFDFQEFIHKVSLRPNTIYIAGNMAGYIQMIEDIYNFGRNKKQHLDLRKLIKN